MQEQILPSRSPLTRRRIVQAAVRLHREIGFKKTTVADVARGASMSPANVYRFFPSKQALEEAVMADLFEQVSAAATLAACGGGSALERLTAVFTTISQLHDDRLANDSKLHELLAAAVRENWPVALSHVDRIRGVVRSIIAAGQVSGEVRSGSPMALTCCLLEAMDAYLSPRINAAVVRPAFDEMMDFCAGALRPIAWGRSIDIGAELRPAELHPTAVTQR